MIGPALGGVLYSTSRLLPFLADALSYAVSVASLFLMRTPFQDERVAKPRRLRAEIAEGLVWLWRQPLIRSIALFGSSINFTVSGSSLLVIVIAERRGASPSVIGVIFTIAALGTIVGSLLGPLVQKRFSFGQAIICTTWLMALVWPLYALAPNPLLLGVISALFFTTTPIYTVVQLSYRLALIPDALQGRVNSVFRLLVFGFQPLGMALAGLLLEQVGPIPAILIFAACLLALALLTTSNPDVRHARPLK